LDQHERIIIGKHGKTAALRRHSSTSIGNRNVPRVRRAKPVVVGHLSRIDEAIPSSQSNLPCRMVVPVLNGSSARTRSQLHPVGFSRCVRSNRIRLYKLHANGKPPRSLKRHTTDVSGLRALSLRAFVLSSYDEHASLCIAKVHLQQVFTATALNFCRISAWLSEQPRALTRQAAFLQLAHNGA
jgi:hypothetical protein